MTMHFDESKIGASHIGRRSKANPQELLLRLIEEADGDPDKDEIFEKWRSEIQKNDVMQRAVDQYFFVNIFNYHVKRSKTPGKSSALTEKLKEQIAEQVRQRVAKIGVLYYQLPSGKLLKDATFAECLKAGGIFTAVGKMGKPDEIVGQKLTEKQLKTAGFGKV
jgi:hypothetical protein